MPIGKYEILEQARNFESFRLDTIDNNPRNNKHDETGRTYFRLHEPGRTTGCIAAEEREQWNELRDMIYATKTEIVDDNATPWWKISTKRIIKYGYLTVE